MMLNHKILISTLSVALFVNFGCGAKDAIVFKPDEHKEIIQIRENESIALMLGKYDHYDGYSEVDTAKKRDDLEKKLEHCLGRAAKHSNPPVKVMPTGIIKEYITQNYNYTNLEEITSPVILKTLQESTSPGDILKTGLRYLIVIDVVTDKNYSSAEFYGDIEASGGMALGVLGLAKEGTKKTSAYLHIIDVRRRLETEQITISSSGSEGWTAGVFIFVILPIPYYVPWWSLTESEVCDEIGKQIVGLVSNEVIVSHITDDDSYFAEDPSHSTDITSSAGDIVSQYGNGDLVSIVFKNGDMKKVTITHVDKRFVVGYVEYSRGHTTGVNYDRRDIKSIEYFK